MKHRFAFLALMIVCASPALARGDRSGPGCDDPQTTGSLPTGMRDLDALAVESDRVAVIPPEDSWQEQAQQNAERRRRERAEGCGVD